MSCPDAYVSPANWRRILVPGSIKLHKLHAVLLRTMGGAGGHLHEFVIGCVFRRNVTEVSDG